MTQSSNIFLKYRFEKLKNVFAPNNFSSASVFGFGLHGYQLEKVNPAYSSVSEVLSSIKLVKTGCDSLFLELWTYKQSHTHRGTMGFDGILLGVLSCYNISKIFYL